MPSFTSENDLLQKAGFTDPRTLRLLCPGVDYHSKIFVDFYPFNDMFRDLLIPPIYVSSGKLEYSFEQRITTNRTLGAVVCDDWSVVDQKVSASGIECIFDAWEIEQADIAGVKVPLPVGMGSTALLSKQGLNTLADMIRTGVYDDNLGATPKSRQGRWSTYWENRGIFLLDLFLAHYKTNATVFDDDGMPVISGNIVIETDYTVPTHPSNTADYDARFSPFSQAASNLGGSTVNAVKGLAGINNDYENQVAKHLYQGSQTIHPQTYIYGKFTSLDFDISKPFSSTINFQFEVMNCLRNIVSPEELKVKNGTQQRWFANNSPKPKFVSDLSGHQMLL